MVLTSKQILESMDELSDNINRMDDSDDGMSSSIDTGVIDSENDIMNQLDSIYTPVLIMQQMDTTDAKMEAMAVSGVLNEHNVIKFDDDTKMSQLMSVCSLLIARDKNSDKYEMYKKAAEMKENLKLDIQKEEYAASKELAQKYLIKVSTSNTSAAAKQAATNLLPYTQR